MFHVYNIFFFINDIFPLELYLLFYVDNTYILCLQILFHIYVREDPVYLDFF